MAWAYAITHRESGREYIGITGRDVLERWALHINSCRRVKTRIAAAIAKYGSRAFDYQVVATLPTRDEAEIAERILIAIRKPEFNMTPGGDGLPIGYKHPPRSPEARARISAAGRGISRGPRDTSKAREASAALRRGKPNPQHSAFMTGRKASEETKLKMAQSQQARRAREAAARGA